MIGDSTQEKLLEKILESREFSGSKIYGAFLKYLYEAKKNGKDIKETTIAIEFFGRDASFNPAEDTIVRSHTYNLRKKLQSYYYDEGKEDKYRLRIPKGHYEVAVVPASARDSTLPGRILTFLKTRYYVYVMLIIVVFAAILWNKTRVLENKLRQYQIIDRDDPIWADYLGSDLPVLVTVGDHFFITDYTTQNEDVLGIRHAKINSPEDLELFRSQHPEYKIEPADEPYFPYHSIWSLPPILSLFYSVNQTPIIRKSSSLSPQMLDEYDIIFLGSIKTLYILKHTLSKSNFSFEISPHKVTYTPADSSKSQVFRTSLHSSGPNDDLVLAVKLPGPVQNSIFIIASFHSLGAPEIAKYLASEDTRNELENRFISDIGRVPKYFEILFRVTGIDKTAYNTEILICEEIRDQ